MQWWRFSLVTAWYPASKISKNRRKIAKKWARNAQKSLSAGVPPQTPLGELTTLPRPPSRLGRLHPSRCLRRLGSSPAETQDQCAPPNQFPGSTPGQNSNTIFLSLIVRVYFHSNFLGGLWKTHVLCNRVHNDLSGSSKVVDFGANQTSTCCLMNVLIRDVRPKARFFW